MMATPYENPYSNHVVTPAEEERMMQGNPSSGYNNGSSFYQTTGQH